MAFFPRVLRSPVKKSESAVCIDVGADSVAGAYMQCGVGAQPSLLYSQRMPLDTRAGEPHEQALFRTLGTLTDTLIREGAPVLLRVTGSGHADTVLVSIDAPWQETSVRVERFERTRPFLFSKRMVIAALEKTRPTTLGKLVIDESIIGISLNGYQTHNPYGKWAHRATVVVLTSSIDRSIAQHMTATLTQTFRAKRVVSIAGSSLRYQAICMIFPHEKQALIVDTAGPTTSIALVHNGFFIALANVPVAARDSAWLSAIIKELVELAKNCPLPHIIFLVSRDTDTSMGQMIQPKDLGTLWLSDHPPKIIPVLPSQISGTVHYAATPPPDLHMLLMALFYQQRLFSPDA